MDNSKCGGYKPENKAYFERLAAVSPMAIAAYMYTRDLTNFDPEQLPPSTATQVAKERGLEVHERFFLRILETRKVPYRLEDEEAPPLFVQLNDTTFTGWIAKADFYRAFRRHLDDAKEKYRTSYNINSFFQKFNSTFKYFRNNKVVNQTKEDNNGKQVRSIRFPMLRTMRDDWRSTMRHWVFEDEKSGVL